MTAYRAAIAIHEKLAAEHPANATCRLNLANDLTPCGEALATLGNWSESADIYAQAVRATNYSWQTMWPCALVQLASGDEAGYRATCAELVARYGRGAAPDAAFTLAFTLIVGDGALSDMNQALALAKRAADAEPTDAIAAVLVGAAQYRTRRNKEAVATLAKALAELERTSATAPGDRDQMLVFRVTGEVLLAQAYREQTGRNLPQKRLDALRQLIDTREAREPQRPGALPAWAVAFAVENAKRELAKLGLPADDSR